MHKIITLFPLAVLAGCQLLGKTTYEGKLGPIPAPTPGGQEIAAPDGAAGTTAARTIHCQNTVVLNPGARVTPGGLNVSCVDGAGKPVDPPRQLFELRPVR